MASSPNRHSPSRSVASTSGDSVASSGHRSTSALILVHDNEEDSDENSFDFSEEEDGVGHNAGIGLILTPSMVFSYFLSPCLKLGAMLILSSQAAIRVSLPAFLIFAFLSVFSRHIWFLMARYSRRTDVGDIVAEALGRRRNKDSRFKTVVRLFARFCSGLVRMLLSVVYFKGAISCLEPFWTDAGPVPTPLILSIVFIVVVGPLCVAPTLESKRLVYSGWLSTGLYVCWLIGIIYAHAEGSLNTDNVMVAQGKLFQDITSVAFAFSSFSTLQIYQGMVGLRGSIGKKEKRYLSIQSMSFFATLVATGLLLPLLFPSVKSHGDKERTEDSNLVHALILTLSTFILLLAIPPLIATSPTIPIPPIRGLRNRPMGRYFLVLVLFLLSLLPRTVEPALEDAAILLVLLSNYFLPAFLHIIVHNLRQPLSIIVDRDSDPQPLLRTGSGYGVSGGSGEGSEDDELETAYDRVTEELLFRKERALQRRRFGKRIMWDIGVWILLVPVGGGGLVWACGRLAGAW